ncbi:MAG: hypothetical protein L6R19_01340 [Alphaproteobacteria bacterium]|nr:hypothetical protein [Alphaproteobacteria bacterium]
MRIDVESTRDASGGEVPIRLALGGRRIGVAEIVDCWPGPDYRYFKIKGEDSALYILRHDEIRGTWDLTMFQRSPP